MCWIVFAQTPISDFPCWSFFFLEWMSYISSELICKQVLGPAGFYFSGYHDKFHHNILIPVLDPKNKTNASALFPATDICTRKSTWPTTRGQHFHFVCMCACTQVGWVIVLYCYNRICTYAFIFMCAYLQCCHKTQNWNPFHRNYDLNL